MKFGPIKAGIGFLLLLLLLVHSFLIKLSAIPIRIWDEARNANNALHMYLQGFSLVTYYEGSPDMWNTKPPLLIWIQVTFMKLFGITEWAVRLPAALSAIGTGIVLWIFCRRYFKQSATGLLAGSILATTYAYVYNHGGRTGDYDAPLVLFCTLYCLSWFCYIESGRRNWLRLFWMFFILAALMKGIAGLMFVPGLFLFTLICRKLKVILRTTDLYIGVAAFILVTGGYYLGREQANPGYLKAVYENELGGRYLTALEEHAHPFDFYIRSMREWLYSWWFYFIVPAFLAGFLSKEVLVQRLTRFNLLMVLPYLLIVSLAGTKLEWYVLPLYPFLALQIGLLLFPLWQFLASRLLLTTTTRSLLSIGLFCLLFAVPFKKVYNHIHHFKEEPWDTDPHKQGYFLQEAVKSNKDLNHYTFLYSGYNGQLAFYITQLQIQHVGVQLNASVEGLTPGSYAVVSQQEIQALLLQHYSVKPLYEKYGCTVYLVQSRL